MKQILAAMLLLTTPVMADENSYTAEMRALALKTCLTDKNISADALHQACSNAIKTGFFLENPSMEGTSQGSQFIAAELNEAWSAHLSTALASLRADLDALGDDQSRNLSSAVAEMEMVWRQWITSRCHISFTLNGGGWADIDRILCENRQYAILWTDLRRELSLD